MVSVKSYKDAKNVLMDRFKFLYKNAPFILAEIQAEHFDEYPALCEDIKKLTGIDGRKLGPFNRSCNPDNITVPYTFLLVEEYLFCDYRDTKTELEIYIENMYKYPSGIVGLLIDEFHLNDVDYGETKKDIAVCVLLELVRSLLCNQNANTLVRTRTVDNDMIYRNGSCSILDFDIGYKKNCLDEYLRLARYRNRIFRFEDEKVLLPNYRLNKLSNISLVDTNVFLVNISDCNLSYDEISSVYFSSHKEIPCDTETVCKKSNDLVSRDINSFSCGSKFYVNEESVFSLVGEVLQLCPKCGYLVNVSDKVSPEVRRRIEARDSLDADVLRKRLLLSELIKIGGMEEAKKLVKKRNNDGGM